MTIALIDDQQPILKLYSAMLVKAGAIKSNDNLYTYSEGTEFLTVIHEEPSKFDVVICDQNLGKGQIEGLDILRGMINVGFQGKAILLTGDNSDWMKKQMEEVPTIDYVLKGSRSEETNPYVVLTKILNTYRKHLNN